MPTWDQWRAGPGRSSIVGWGEIGDAGSQQERTSGVVPKETPRGIKDEERSMFASPWMPDSPQPRPIGGEDLAAQIDDDAVLDDWLASMTVPQFECIMSLLIERLGVQRSTLDRPA